MHTAPRLDRENLARYLVAERLRRRAPDCALSEMTVPERMMLPGPITWAVDSPPDGLPTTAPYDMYVFFCF
jgi:hypothetical protein